MQVGPALLLIIAQPLMPSCVLCILFSSGVTWKAEILFARARTAGATRLALALLLVIAQPLAAVLQYRKMHAKTCARNRHKVS